MDKLPKIVLSGFLGMGETTRFNRILNNTDEIKVALIVNHMRKININAKPTRKKNLFSSTEDKKKNIREKIVNNQPNRK